MVEHEEAGHLRVVLPVQAPIHPHPRPWAEIPPVEGKELPELRPLRELLRHPMGGRVTPHRAYHRPLRTAGRGIHQAAGARGGHARGLLQEDVQSALQGREGHFLVDGGRRADEHGLQRLLQEVRGVGEGAAAGEASGGALRSLLAEVAHRRHLERLQRGQAWDVNGLGQSTAADDAEADRSARHGLPSLYGKNGPGFRRFTASLSGRKNFACPSAKR
jgi:hypothetical protein